MGEIAIDENDIIIACVYIYVANSNTKLSCQCNGAHRRGKEHCKYRQYHISYLLLIIQQFIDVTVGRQGGGVGHGLKSCTKEIRAVRYPHPDGERNIVLVDTPGFDDTFVSDAEILRKIAEWLRTT